MEIPTYQGYATHDPHEAINAYAEKHNQKPTIILIRPGYPVTEDHPLLLETVFCGARIMMVSHKIDIAGYKEYYRSRSNVRRKRKILDAKLLRKLKTRERELEDAYIQDGTGHFMTDPEIEAMDKSWIRSIPTVMTDNQYLEAYQKPGYVYLLKSENGYQKIGRSIDVEKRRVEIERDIPLRIDIEHCFHTKYYIAAEAYLHKKYDSQRVKYEWFRLSENQIEDIKSIKDYDLDEAFEKKMLHDRIKMQEMNREHEPG